MLTVNARTNSEDRRVTLGYSGANRPSAGARLLADTLFVQVAPSDAHVAQLLGGRPGGGVIFTGSSAVTHAEMLQREGSTDPVLVDRRRYAGESRARGTAAFDPRWLESQRRLGLPEILSDSGYVAQNDRAALAAVLQQARAAGPDVTAVLPLPTWWLRDGLDQLVAEVLDHAVPVALVLEHTTDPLSVLAAVRGLVQLLGCGADVSLLSTDVSALGALCFGARWAAVGSRPSVRHLSPAGSRFRGTSTVASALVDPALALVKLDKIAAAWAASQDDPWWACWCTVCCGRTLQWMYLSASEAEVHRHTAELLLDRRDALVALPPGEARRLSWRESCRSAAFQYQSMRLVGLEWEVPRFLRHWQAV